MRVTLTRHEKVQATLLVVSLVMLVAILSWIAGHRSVPPADYGVDWQRPVGIDVDPLRVDLENDTLVVRAYLTDSESLVTEWDGEFEVTLADRDNSEIYRETLPVRAEDFTTVLLEDVLTTYMDIPVPLEDLSYVSDGMRTDPLTNLAARVTFSFEDELLVNEVWWWPVPTEVLVVGVWVDEDGGELDLKVNLNDGTGVVTKWGGDLRIIVWDSNDLEMYNGTHPVRARDFDIEVRGWTVWTYYRISVPFEAIDGSSDRMEVKPDGSPGRWMRVFAWFETDDGVVKQSPTDLVAYLTANRIPDELLLENEPPEVRVSHEEWGLAGVEHVFDASNTTDDIGEEGLVYAWDFGDGSGPLVTNATRVGHVFEDPGSYAVSLTVTDIEGASSTLNTTVEVIRDPRVDREDLEDLEPGEVLWESLLLEKLRELLPERDLAELGVGLPDGGR